MFTPPMVPRGAMWVLKTCTLADWKAGGMVVAGTTLAADLPAAAGAPGLADAEAITPSTSPAAAAPIAIPVVLPRVARMRPPSRLGVRAPFALTFAAAGDPARTACRQLGEQSATTEHRSYVTVARTAKRGWSASSDSRTSTRFSTAATQSAWVT